MENIKFEENFVAEIDNLRGVFSHGDKERKSFFPGRVGSLKVCRSDTVQQQQIIAFIVMLMITKFSKRKSRV